MIEVKVNRSNGSALLEAMISMVVLLVGVMGFIQLQHIGVKRLHDTKLREEGVKAINQLAETIRAGGGDALPAGFYANPAALTPITDCQTSTCNANQLMRYKMDILLREMVGFGAASGWAVVNRVGVCLSYNAGTDPTLAQVDFLWKGPTDISNLMASDCPAFGNRPVVPPGFEFYSISTLVNL